MKVIILDHHEKFVNDQKEVVLPDADVLCDPHVTGADFVDYCGAGLMYIFANSIVSTCPWLSDGAKEKFHAVTSVYAAIGTVADVVSLTGENRRIVKAGIKNALAGRASTGMMELLKDANMLDRITAPQMAFFLCPMFNAYERLDDGGSAEVSDATSYMGVHDESIENDCQIIKDKMRNVRNLQKRLLLERLIISMLTICKMSVLLFLSMKMVLLESMDLRLARLQKSTAAQVLLSALRLMIIF